MHTNAYKKTSAFGQNLPHTDAPIGFCKKKDKQKRRTHQPNQCVGNPLSFLFSTSKKNGETSIEPCTRKKQSVRLCPNDILFAESIDYFFIFSPFSMLDCHEYSIFRIGMQAAKYVFCMMMSECMERKRRIERIFKMHLFVSIVVEGWKERYAQN